MKANRLIRCAALLVSIMLADAQAATYQYIAQTGAPVLKSGTVVAAGISWKCSGNLCTTSGPWPAPGVDACQALAKQVGPITGYGYKGRMLNPEEIRVCNGGSVGVKPALAGPAVQKPQQPPPPDAASRKFSPVTIRTAALAITGTGSSAPVGAGFKPLTIRTAPLAITGTGSSAPVGAGFTPIILRTAPLTLTGTGSL